MSLLKDLMIQDSRRFETQVARLGHLAAIGVREISDGETTISFHERLPTDEPLASTAPAVSASPSIPERTGTTEAEPRQDIFDVLESGQIPGAPGADSNWKPVTDG